MKVTVVKKELQRILDLVASTAGDTDELLLEASAGHLTAKVHIAKEGVYLSAMTDVADIAQDGAFLVNANKFYEVLKTFSGDSVALSGKESKLTAKSEKTRVSFNGKVPDPETYPSFPSVDESAMNPVDGKTFRGMIEKTVFAVPAASDRVFINGLFLEKGGTTAARAVATDGYRLACIEVPIELKDSLFISKAGVREVQRLLKKAEGTVMIGADKTYFVLRDGNIKVVVSLIHGDFVDYRKAVPGENVNNRVLVMSREALLAMLRRAMIIFENRNTMVTLDMNPQGLTISSLSNIGDETEESEAEYSGESLKIKVNSSYLTEAVRAIEGEKVRLEFKDESSAIVVKPANTTGYFNLIMPVMN